MPKLTTFFLAVLFFACAGFALNNSGLIGCDGLFLLNDGAKKVSLWGCRVGDSLNVDRWKFVAGMDYFRYKLNIPYDGGKDEKSWTLGSSESLSIGRVAVSKDFEYFGMDLAVNTLPSIRVSPRMHLPDSLLFAKAAISKGLLDFSGIEWESDWKEDYVPEIDAVYRSVFLLKEFSVGTNLKNHLLEGSFIYGATTPAVDDEWGYVFSDSSDFWATKANYLYRGKRNEFAASYAYLYADIRLFGLTREKGEETDEKRFAYFPLGIDLNLFELLWKHSFENGDILKTRAVYGTLEVNIPWENRRFYETLAPNRALKKSILKTLSFSVFQRAFRVYGDVDVQLADAGFTYERNPQGMFSPEVSFDLFYASYEAELYLRKESSGFFYVNHKTDSWKQNGYVVGSVIGLGARAQSASGKFFAGIHLDQLVPFYYDIENGKKAKKKTDSSKSSESDKPKQQDNTKEPGRSGTSDKMGWGSESAQPEKETDKPSTPSAEQKEKSDKRSYSLPSYMFRNGFAVSVQIGFRI